MSLTSIKSKLQAQRGFTIVELLIVIVVIGILAAITIVAYSGVTSRANAAKAQTNAATIQKVAEAYAADPTINTGLYPSSVSALTSYSGTTRVPSGVTPAEGTTTISSATCNSTTTTINATCLGATGNFPGTTYILYLPVSGNTGACIGWYDYQSASTKWVFAGNAKTPTFTSSALGCSTT